MTGQHLCNAITQTGGQCRASNYISLIKKALIENGYTHTPILSIAFGSRIDNQQPGFKVNWLKVLPIALAAVLYSDCIAKSITPPLSVRKSRDRQLN